MGGGSPLPYFENGKSALVLKKSVWFLRICGLNFLLKSSFKSALEKKHPHFSLRGPFFVYVIHEMFIEMPLF